MDIEVPVITAAAFSPTTAAVKASVKISVAVSFVTRHLEPEEAYSNEYQSGER